jgi:FKBP-type peptidyl-prolyl cis-trans isomerase
MVIVFTFVFRRFLDLRNLPQRKETRSSFQRKETKLQSDTEVSVARSHFVSQTTTGKLEDGKIFDQNMDKGAFSKLDISVTLTSVQSKENYLLH